MKQSNLIKAIKLAGGQHAVAALLGISQSRVSQFVNLGFPSSEWSGVTEYAKRICKAGGQKYEHDQILWQPACKPISEPDGNQNA